MKTLSDRLSSSRLYTFRQALCIHQIEFHLKAMIDYPSLADNSDSALSGMILVMTYSEFVPYSDIERLKSLFDSVRSFVNSSNNSGVSI